MYQGRFSAYVCFSLALFAFAPADFVAPGYGQISTNSNSNFLPPIEPPTSNPAKTGYLDTAFVRNQIRFRVDAVYGINRPDRAEYYIKRLGGVETRMDYQEISVYLENRVTQNWSWFIESPLRFCNPELASNVKGLVDLRAGIRGAIFERPGHALTYQLRFYFPTGDLNRDEQAGLPFTTPAISAGHFSIEPALLYHRQITDRWAIDAAYHIWIPLGGSSALPTADDEFSGAILQYGVSTSYDIPTSLGYTFTPVAEMVGWSVLDGFATTTTNGITPIVESAAGDTIINLKFGARLQEGRGRSLYLGYGFGATNDIWYTDILRLEYRFEY